MNEKERRALEHVKDSTEKLSKKYQSLRHSVLITLQEPQPAGLGLGDLQSAKDFLKERVKTSCVQIHNTQEMKPEKVSVDFLHVYSWAHLLADKNGLRFLPEADNLASLMADEMENAHDAKDNVLVASEYIGFYTELKRLEEMEKRQFSDMLVVVKDNLKSKKERPSSSNMPSPEHDSRHAAPFSNSSGTPSPEAEGDRKSAERLPLGNTGLRHVAPKAAAPVTPSSSEKPAAIKATEGIKSAEQGLSGTNTSSLDGESKWRSLLYDASEAERNELLQTHWPGLGNLTDDGVELWNLVCLTIVYRNIFRYVSNVETGLSTMRDLRHRLRKTDSDLWDFIWYDFTRVPLQSLAGKALALLVDLDSLEDPRFKTLSENTLKQFWEHEVLQIYDVRYKLGSLAWTVLVDAAGHPDELLEVVNNLPKILKWDGTGDLGQSVAKYFEKKILSRSNDLPLKIVARCKMPPILRISYKSANEVPDAYGSLQYFELHFREVYPNFSGYRLLAAVRLAGSITERDSIRIFDDFGKWVRPVTPMPLYPTKWSLSEANQEFMLYYASVHEKDMPIFRSQKHPEFPPVGFLSYHRYEDFQESHPAEGANPARRRPNLLDNDVTQAGSAERREGVAPQYHANRMNVTSGYNDDDDPNKIKVPGSTSWEPPTQKGNKRAGGPSSQRKTKRGGNR